MLELLRSQSAHAARRRPAALAGGPELLFVTAVVAAQRTGCRVDRERDGAARTAGYGAAGRTLQKGSKAAPVEQQDHLLLALQRLAHGAVERLAPRHGPGLGNSLRGPEIHDFHGRERAVADAARQLHAAHAAVVDLVQQL